MRSLVALLLIVPSISNAFTVDTSTAVGTGFSTGWTLDPGAFDHAGLQNLSGDTLSASLAFELLSFDTAANAVSFLVTASNLSEDTDGDGDVSEIGLRGFAFGLDTELASHARAITLEDATVAMGGDRDDDAFITASEDVPSDLVSRSFLDIAVETGNGARRTLQAGETDLFILSLLFEDLGDSLAIGPFDAKFQSEPDSFHLTTVVPLPSAAWLFATALLMLAGVNSRAGRQRYRDRVAAG